MYNLNVLILVSGTQKEMDDRQWHWEMSPRNVVLRNALGVVHQDEVTDLSLRCPDYRSILVHRVVGMLFSNFLRTRLLVL